MSFVSTGFLLFLLIGVIVYYFIPKKVQWIWLLFISYFYYATYGIKPMAFIAFTTISTYIGGRFIEKYSNDGANKILKNKPNITSEEKKKIKANTKGNKRKVVLIMLLFNFGILAVLKYFNFGVENINGIMHRLFGIQYTIAGMDLLLPLGISFYTFQSMGYIIDIYQGKYEADKNIFKFALFVSFFPQILQGPIGRYNRLAHQFYEKHYFDLTKIQQGLQLICWGFFKKLVIADRAGIIANQVFDHDDKYAGVIVIVGVLAYCIQLYGDFAGGMDVVMGTAELFDIKIDANFRQPFFSHSISEFWRRWHITLGTWMKDYIFYPFSLSKGMNKFGKFSKKKFGNAIGRVLPICLADLLIFFIVGLWHGASWKFIIYGLYNGFIIAFSGMFQPVYIKMFEITHINAKTRTWRLFQIFRTFVLINIGWYFDRGNSLKDAVYMMYYSVKGFSFSALTDGSLLKLGLDSLQIMILIAACVVWFIVSVLKEKNIEVREAIARRILPIRWAIYIALIISIPLLGTVSAKVGGFIYAQF